MNEFPVDLHTHTVASTHAFSTLLEYIPYAVQKGVKLIATTDHGPIMPDAPHEWHFFNLRVLPRAINGVVILRGMEANICSIDGEIDCSDRAESQLDIVLASLHEPVFSPQSEENNTQAMINTIRSGRVDIIGHPGNPRYPIDIYSVVEEAHKHNVALEINNSSFVSSRLGSAPNCMKIAKVIKDVGGLVSLGSDSHFAMSVGDFSHCLTVLNEIDFPYERVINHSVNSTLDFLISRGRHHLREIKEQLLVD